MKPQEMELHSEEAASSLAVEGMTMTELEKENLRKVGRGEISFAELCEEYIAEAKKLGTKHARRGLRLFLRLKR
jgi:hypothetical protein